MEYQFNYVQNFCFFFFFIASISIKMCVLIPKYSIQNKYSTFVLHLKMS